MDTGTMETGVMKQVAMTPWDKDPEANNRVCDAH